MENITNNETILKLNNIKTGILKNNIKTLTKSGGFGFKIIIGLLPIILIIIFTSVSLSLTLWCKHHGVFPKSGVPKYETKLAELQSGSNISVSFMVIFGNLTLYTLIFNFAFFCFLP